MRQTVPHYMPVARERGMSPGNGISAPLLSEDPLMTEEEFFTSMAREQARAELLDPPPRPPERGRERGVGALLPGPERVDALFAPRDAPGPPRDASAPQEDALIPAFAAGDTSTFGPDFTR